MYGSNKFVVLELEYNLGCLIQQATREPFLWLCSDMAWLINKIVYTGDPVKGKMEGTEEKRDDLGMNG